MLRMRTECQKADDLGTMGPKQEYVGLSGTIRQELESSGFTFK
jgi:hypothetical protein